jgi:transmembrane sensor
MRRLPLPLRTVLRDGVDDVGIHRMWRRIERRREDASLRASQPNIARRAVQSALALVPAAALAWLAFWLVTARREKPAGPLQLLDQSPLTAMESFADSPRDFAFDDGSHVTLQAGAALHVRQNDGRAFGSSLHDGDALFDVRPGGPRRWSIDCGAAAVPVTVEVVGTRFHLTCESSSARISVERGIVLVRGANVPDGQVRLSEGKSLTVDRALPLPSSVESPPLPPASAAHEAPLDTLSAKPARGAASSEAWKDLARRGAYDQAYGLLGAPGVHRVSDTGAVSDLLAVADVARLSGHPADAIAPLRRVVTDHAGDSRAPLAAFMLGRLEFAALGNAGAAADAFALAIAVGLPHSLVEDAYARLVEARVRAGDRAGARRAAKEYDERFPGGPHAAAIAAWVAEP